MKVHVFTCRADNYGVLLHDSTTGATAAIDAPDAEAVRAALRETGWKLSHILVTHQHFDHIEGIPALKQETGCRVIAPASADKIAALADDVVREGSEVQVGSLRATVWETPGHCSDHVGFWFESQGVFFAGDTLFALGCGRVFDDAYDLMWHSLSRLLTLPDTTQVYFGHEYTQANAAFALSVDPENPDLQARFSAVKRLRAEGKMTIPTSMGEEKATNPFLRVRDKAIRTGLGMQDRPDALVFKALRERKNRF